MQSLSQQLAGIQIAKENIVRTIEGWKEVLTQEAQEISKRLRTAWGALDDAADLITQRQEVLQQVQAMCKRIDTDPQFEMPHELMPAQKIGL